MTNDKRRIDRQLLFHGQRLSGETVPRHFHMELPRLYKVDRWIHNRSPVIVQTEHGRSMSNDRLSTVAWFFFFPWEKVNRETRTRFHERYHSSLVCLKPTCESRFISYSYQQYLFILLRDIILYRINVESRILLLLRINALI